MPTFLSLFRICSQVAPETPTVLINTSPRHEANRGHSCSCRKKTPVFQPIILWTCLSLTIYNDNKTNHSNINILQWLIRQCSFELFQCTFTHTHYKNVAIDVLHYHSPVFLENLFSDLFEITKISNVWHYFGLDIGKHAAIGEYKAKCRSPIGHWRSCHVLTARKTATSYSLGLLTPYWCQVFCYVVGYSISWTSESRQTHSALLELPIFWSPEKLVALFYCTI